MPYEVINPLTAIVVCLCRNLVHICTSGIKRVNSTALLSVANQCEHHTKILGKLMIMGSLTIALYMYEKQQFTAK